VAIVHRPIVGSFKKFDEALYAFALQGALQRVLFVDCVRPGRSVDWFYNDWYYSGIRYVMYISRCTKCRMYTEYSSQWLILFFVYINELILYYPCTRGVAGE
jgi:hypothetical protein